jgi:hypothetical protein
MKWKYAGWGTKEIKHCRQKNQQPWEDWDTKYSTKNEAANK